MSFKKIRKIIYTFYVLISLLILYFTTAINFFIHNHYLKIIILSIISFIFLGIFSKIVNYELSIYLTKKKVINQKIIKLLFKFNYLDNQDLVFLNNIRNKQGNESLKYFK